MNANDLHELESNILFDVRTVNEVIKSLGDLRLGFLVEI